MKYIYKPEKRERVVSWCGSYSSSGEACNKDH